VHKKRLLEQLKMVSITIFITGELPCHTKEIFTRNKLLTVYNLIAKNYLTAMHRVYRKNYPKPILEIFNANRNPDYTARRGPEILKYQGHDWSRSTRH